MNIAILGNGNVGQALSKLLASKDVTVYLGARSHEGKNYPKGIEASSLEEACQASDLIASAMPWSLNGELVSLSVLRKLPLAGKVVIDMTNPLNPDWSPLSLGADNSAGEETAKALPQSHVVKAFNTLFADMMDPARLNSLTTKPTGFYCGNEASAKSKVSHLLAKAGLDPIDAGSIDSSRYLEQMAHLNIRLALSVKDGTQAVFSYHRI